MTGRQATLTVGGEKYDIVALDFEFEWSDSYTMRINLAGIVTTVSPAATSSAWGGGY